MADADQELINNNVICKDDESERRKDMQKLKENDVDEVRTWSKLAAALFDVLIEHTQSTFPVAKEYVVSNNARNPKFSILSENLHGQLLNSLISTACYNHL